MDTERHEAATSPASANVVSAGVTVHVECHKDQVAVSKEKFRASVEGFLTFFTTDKETLRQRVTQAGND